MVGGSMTTNTSLDVAIENILKQMTEDQRDHFKVIMAALLPCYIHDSQHAVVLVGTSDVQGLTALNHILNINSTDINASQLLDGANEHMSAMVMQDAPDRNMYH